MTDMSYWTDLINVCLLRNVNWHGNYYEPPSYSRYVVVPLNEYQMGNLVDALAQVQDNGDWYGEVCNIISTAMRKAGIAELTSNRGNKYTVGDVNNYLRNKK